MRESGRSFCTGGTFSFNSHTVQISASQWNTWLGASGNTMTIQVTASPAVKRLYSYCCDIGINGCQSFCPNCAPESLSVIDISYVACASDAHCNDGNPCTNDACNAGVCQHANNSSACSDGLFCN